MRNDDRKSTKPKNAPEDAQTWSDESGQPLVNTDPMGQPQDGEKRIVAPDPEKVKKTNTKHEDPR